jgi:hypothetical protein
MVEALEEEGRAVNLNNCEVYFFTDHSTIESVLHKGKSSSHKFLELVIRCIAVQAKYSVVVRVCHCAGARMIASGGDGISRGQVNEGVIAGEPMSEFLPLHVLPLERLEGLLEWIKSWPVQDLMVLEPLEWFERGHDITGWARVGGGIGL